MISPRRQAAFWLLASVCALAAGCGESTRQGAPALDPRDKVTHDVYPALAGSVAEVAALGTNQPLRVEGYGIVADLPATGSNEMPPQVRAILTEQLFRAGAGSARDSTADIDPRRILESDRIAVVEVRGLIPPMAANHSHFDLSLIALPGTQTTSLSNGLLWTTELKVIGLGSNVETRTIALGRGPVYCVPDAPEAVVPATQPVATQSTATQPAAKRNLRRGRVLGGGELLEAMPVTLQAYAPSHRTTAMIQRLINAHFPHRPPLAEAQNESLISLTIPEEYTDNPQEFIDLILHMYPAMDTPGFVEKRTTELLRALRDPKAPHAEISLALQGLGRTIIEPYLRAEYTSSDPVVRFYTAKAGAAMQDVQASVVLEEFARNPASPFRLEAIEALGIIGRHGGSIQRSTVLLAGTLLNDKDTAVRLAAYRALRTMRSPAIEAYRTRLFDIDLVSSTGPTLIYATQTGRARIAIIGNRLETLAPGVLYISPDNLLTINVPEDLPSAGPVSPAADKRDTKPTEPVLLYYRGPMGDQSITMKSSANLAMLLARLGYVPDPRALNYDPRQPFIGLSYQRVIEVVSALCRTNAVHATLILQPPPAVGQSITDLAEDARPEGLVVTPTTSTAPATRPAQRRP